MKHHTFKLSCLAAAMAFGAGNATAADMRIDGFASLYYGQAIEDEGGSTYADKAYGDKADFQQDSTYGIQFRADLENGLSATAQILGKGINNFEADVAWAYFTYQINDSFSVKGGRQRLPYFLYSDFLDVGYAYHWISPPSEVYAVGGFDNLDGVNLEYFGNWGDATSRINLMFGGTSVDSTQDFSVDTRNHWLISWDLNWNWLTLHMSYSETSTTISAINDAADAIAGVMAGAGFPLTAEQYDALTVENDKGTFAGIGLIADFGDWFAGAEWTTAGIKDTVINTEKDAWFVTGGYRYDKFTISLTYASYDVPNDSIGFDALAADQIPLLPGTQDVNFFLDQAIAAADPFTQFSLASIQDSLVNAVMLGGYEADSYNITVRYDFHPSAAFKFDYTAEEATYYHTGRNIEPQLVRMGVDLVF